MPERLPSDHDAVDTYRAEIARRGGTRRPCLRLPAELDAREGGNLEDGDLVRIVIDRSDYHARVRRDASGLFLGGAFDNRRLARTTGEGENRLVAWLESLDRGPGDGVDLDAVTPGEQYGLREPGERAVYEATRGPDESLAEIARDLE